MLEPPLRTVKHSAPLADYDGIFALFRKGAAIVSFPADCIDEMRGSLPSPPFTPEEFVSSFAHSAFTVIGPAYIGYTAAVQPPVHPVRALVGNDAAAVEALRAACPETDWEHGGSTLHEDSTCSGVFAADSRLVALAGYEVWGTTIAHISVVTHPSFRGRGFGRSAVAHVARVALAAGLLPQYRTLESNRASMRVAESLGFSLYATSVAIRLNRGRPR